MNEVGIGFNRIAAYFYSESVDRADLISKIGQLVHMYASDAATDD